MVIEIPKDWIEKEIDSEGQIVFHRFDFFWNRALQANTGTANFQFTHLEKLYDLLYVLHMAMPK